MSTSEWKWDQIVLAGTALYFILALFGIATRELRIQFRRSSKMNITTVQSFDQVWRNPSSTYESTAIRLIIFWVFSFSVAFLTFARLQCGSAVSLEPKICSIILQFLLASEMHLIAAESFFHRYRQTKNSKNCRCVLVKFAVFTLCIPAVMIAALYLILGPTGFQTTALGEATPSTGLQENETTNHINKTINNFQHNLSDRKQSENCWIDWSSSSVKVTSSLAIASFVVTFAITVLNLVTLLKQELRGIQVSYRIWWNVAARMIFMVITIAKWASVAFQSSCSSNFYNTIATIFVTPILLALMFKKQPGQFKKTIFNNSRLRRRDRQNLTLDVIELCEPQEAEPMLQHDVLNGDVTHNVTGLYTAQKYLGHEKLTDRHNGNMGENHMSCDYNDHSNARQCYITSQDRHSTDVDDGVMSSDGDYDNPCTSDAIDIEMDTTPNTSFAGNRSSGMRLSPAESTDSGMGFGDNVKYADNSRLSDGYGTIHLVSPQETMENRKSLIDGDVEYDEVMEFISTPSEHETENYEQTSDAATGKTTNSKYAELDLAKILHTRRRHKTILTTPRKLPEEEKLPAEGMFNSLKRKTKSKNYSFGNYATYGRGRKSPKQPSQDAWTSRPSSTCNGNDELSPLSDRIAISTSLDRRSNYALRDYGQSYSNTIDMRQRELNNDLMMTSDVNDDVGSGYATIDKRTSWRSNAKSPVVDMPSPIQDTTSNRWSWLSNTSQTQTPASEKVSTPTKSPWRIFRRLLGGGDQKPKRSNSTMSATNMSPRSSSTSIFRRFSTRKSNKQSLSKRRGSVPAKSEWDMHTRDDDDSNDVTITVPVIDAAKQKPVLPKSMAQKPRGRLSTRLMSFRSSNKSRHSKNLKTDPMSKGLSISSPQLAINAIDPTRNYSEHQLLNLSSDIKR